MYITLLHLSDSKKEKRNQQIAFLINHIIYFLSIFGQFLKNKRKMNKKNKKIQQYIITGIIALCLIGGSAFYYLLFYPQFHPTKNSYVYIDKDDTADSIYNKVKEEGKASNLTGFYLMAKLRNLGKNIHTGRYLIRPNDNNYRVFNRISRGHQEPLNLAIGSVRTLDRLARSVGKQLMIDSADIAKVLFDSTFQAKLGYNEATMPCLFIPETYQVYWDMSTEEFFERMQKEHKRFWSKERMDKAASIGMTPEEVCTLASIVEEETNNNQEKPMVAGLYINRLHANMPLQADPTIKFALQDFALRRISNENTKVNSPYNTYKNTGLPPGPIRIPSVNGIESVLNYTKHNFIYMCAKEDFSGTHNFASDYNAHMQNAKKYWKALNERKIFQ